MTLKRVAKAGIFNLSGYTPMEAAGKAGLYEVFTFLSAEKAEQDVIENQKK